MVGHLLLTHLLGVWEWQIPDYKLVIHKPMDFGTMRQNTAKGFYVSLDAFEADAKLVCNNAMLYNAPDTIYHKEARALKEMLPGLFRRAGVASPPSQPHVNGTQFRRASSGVGIGGGADMLDEKKGERVTTGPRIKRVKFEGAHVEDRNGPGSRPSPEVSEEESLGQGASREEPRRSGGRVRNQEGGPSSSFRVLPQPPQQSSRAAKREGNEEEEDNEGGLEGQKRGSLNGGSQLMEQASNSVRKASGGNQQQHSKRLSGGVSADIFAPRETRQQTAPKETRRMTYLPRQRQVDGQGPPLAAPGGEAKLLVAQVSGARHAASFACSLARFASSLGPVAWAVASAKISSALGPSVPFGRGWVGQKPPDFSDSLQHCKEYMDKEMIEAASMPKPVSLQKEHQDLRAQQGQQQSQQVHGSAALGGRETESGSTMRVHQKDLDFGVAAEVGGSVPSTRAGFSPLHEGHSAAQPHRNGVTWPGLLPTSRRELSATNVPASFYHLPTHTSGSSRATGNRPSIAGTATLASARSPPQAIGQSAMRTVDPAAQSPWSMEAMKEMYGFSGQSSRSTLKEGPTSATPPGYIAGRSGQSGAPGASSPPPLVLATAPPVFLETAARLQSPPIEKGERMGMSAAAPPLPFGWAGDGGGSRSGVGGEGSAALRGSAWSAGQHASGGLLPVSEVSMRASKGDGASRGGPMAKPGLTGATGQGGTGRGGDPLLLSQSNTSASPLAPVPGGRLQHQHQHPQQQQQQVQFPQSLLQQRQQQMLQHEAKAAIARQGWPDMHPSPQSSASVAQISAGAARPHGHSSMSNSWGSSGNFAALVGGGSQPSGAVSSHRESHREAKEGGDVRGGHGGAAPLQGTMLALPPGFPSSLQQQYQKDMAARSSLMQQYQWRQPREPQRLPWQVEAEKVSSEKRPTQTDPPQAQHHQLRQQASPPATAEPAPLRQERPPAQQSAVHHEWGSAPGIAGGAGGVATGVRGGSGGRYHQSLPTAYSSRGASPIMAPTASLPSSAQTSLAFHDPFVLGSSHTKDQRGHPGLLDDSLSLSLGGEAGSGMSLRQPTSSSVPNFGEKSSLGEAGGLSVARGPRSVPLDFDLRLEPPAASLDE
eukprot:TRINITY_DN2785_c0_g1_i3.p1 TRINITY_DN2785_c0_g1~~TRINITY_DN2785_c0_g1_i3.p1  ORF type:complete len:1106 (+),score=233.07 TRINITY_DN2785_c0_g1_i3:125-3442(+)